MRIRDNVGFFQAVRAVLAKNTTEAQRPGEELDEAIRQIISKAVVSEQVVDIFAAAGLKKPDISILSDEFLAEVNDMPQRNLAVELLQKLLKGEVRTRSKHNVVQAQSFAELLEQAVRKYQNRAIETARVIEELIRLAKDMRAAGQRGEQLGLNNDEEQREDWFVQHRGHVLSAAFRRRCSLRRLSIDAVLPAFFRYLLADDFRQPQGRRTGMIAVRKY